MTWMTYKGIIQNARIQTYDKNSDVWKRKILGWKIWNGWLLSLGILGRILTTKVSEQKFWGDVTVVYVEYGGSYMNVYIFQDH